MDHFANHSIWEQIEQAQRFAEDAAARERTATRPATGTIAIRDVGQALRDAYRNSVTPPAHASFERVVRAPVTPDIEGAW